MVHDDEKVLIAAAAEGDDDAFGEIVERYQKPVYNLGYRLLGNHGDAEDASQEAFMKAFKGLKKYDPPVAQFLPQLGRFPELALKSLLFRWFQVALVNRPMIKLARLHFDLLQVLAVRQSKLP